MYIWFTTIIIFHIIVVNFLGRFLNTWGFVFQAIPGDGNGMIFRFDPFHEVFFTHNDDNNSGLMVV